MKRIILILIVSLFIFSCEKDDDVFMPQQVKKIHVMVISQGIRSFEVGYKLSTWSYLSFQRYFASYNDTLHIWFSWPDSLIYETKYSYYTIAYINGIIYDENDHSLDLYTLKIPKQH